MHGRIAKTKIFANTEPVKITISAIFQQYLCHAVGIEINRHLNELSRQSAGSVSPACKNIRHIVKLLGSDTIA
jgi:hypothetical protein